MLFLRRKVVCVSSSSEAEAEAEGMSFREVLTGETLVVIEAFWGRVTLGVWASISSDSCGGGVGGWMGWRSGGEGGVREGGCAGLIRRILELDFRY